MKIIPIYIVHVQYTWNSYIYTCTCKLGHTNSKQCSQHATVGTFSFNFSKYSRLFHQFSPLTLNLKSGLGYIKRECHYSRIILSCIPPSIGSNIITLIRLQNTCSTNLTCISTLSSYVKYLQKSSLHFIQCLQFNIPAVCTIFSCLQCVHMC